jgi:oxidase EvaA
VQLSPTLQATHSNYTRVHQGRVPPYLNYFLRPSGHTTIVDSLQSEQGGRFYRKRNRNMVLEISEEIDVLPDFHWLTLAQIQQLMYEENIVNMDTRTVIGCLPVHKTDGELPQGVSPFGARLVRSLSATTSASSIEEVVAWLDCQRAHYQLSTRTIPLNDVDEWHKGEMDIAHSGGDYFSIIACEVEAASREVGSWSQPLVRACASGLSALIVKDIDGILHALVQAKVEPGLMNTVEIAPSVQCTTGDYRRGPKESRAPFLDYVLNAKQSQTRFDSHLSEEGGRFFREANRNMILEADSSFPEALPRNYLWATLRQLKQLVEGSNMLNVECRCLLSCLALLDRGKEEPWLSFE